MYEIETASSFLVADSFFFIFCFLFKKKKTREKVECGIRQVSNCPATKARKAKKQNRRPDCILSTNKQKNCLSACEMS